MLNYTLDHTALQKQRSEYISIAYSVLQDRDLAARVVDSLCSLSPPQDPPHVMEMITVRSMGSSGGRSRKPGNVLANIGSLAEDFGDIGLAAAAVAADHRLVPLAALSIWAKIWKNSKVELTSEQATLAYAIWINREAGNLISRDQAREMHKLICINNDLPEPTEKTFDAALSVLISLGSVEPHSSGKIWIREWVRNTYS